MMNVTVIAESTPGPIMVNLAAYIGSAKAGLFGALVATLAVVLPSFIIILLVMMILKTAFKNKYVQAVLRGLKPCIIGIILSTGCYMIANHCISTAAESRLNKPALLITAVLFKSYFGSRTGRKKGISPIMLILISACLGMVVYG